MEIKIRDIDVHYESVGEGRPFIVIHGWTGNGRMFMGDYEPLFENRPGWRRIYPDMLGHGRTPTPPWLKGTDDVLDVLLEFIDAVAPGERFVMVGISWGGYLARGVVHHRLKHIDGVMLIGPLMEPVAEKRILPARQVIRADPDMVAALQPGEHWIANGAVIQSRALLEHMRANSRRYFTPTDPVAVSVLADKPFSFDPDTLPQVCPAPALFLTGRQDNVVGYKQVWQVLENYPRVTFAVLDGAGHFLGVEQPVLVRAFTSEWLDRVEEYVGDHQAKM